MAALMVFIVFLIAIAVSVPIGVAMCLGTLFPQYFMNAGAPVDQLINFTLSGATPLPSWRCLCSSWAASSWQRAASPAGCSTSSPTS